MPISQEDTRFVYLKQFYTINQIEKYCSGLEDRLEELYQETQPVEVDIIELADANNVKYLCDSPDGWVPVALWRNKGTKPTLGIQCDNNASITASEDHLFQLHDGSWKYAHDLQLGDRLLCSDGSCGISEIASKGAQTVYDLAIDHENHRYYTNGISSHNSGKSILLQNLALNWAKAGATVVYFTLELAEDMSSFRLDSMLTGLSTQEIVQDLDKSSLMIGMQGKGAGKLFVKKMPEGSTTTNNLRGFLKELQIKTGLKPDAILVDYLDLMYPNNQRVDPSDLFVKDKFVSEELRALMHETGTYGATASQLNRGAIQAQGEFDHSHIAGGISKINTADNVFYIYAPDHYKERGEYEIHFLKTRSSASTGQKIKLHYDRKCMRLSDPGEEFAFAADKPATREDLKAELSSKIQSKVAPAPTNALSELMSRTRRNT